MRPLLVLAPIEPCHTGNGLAMRVASFVDAAADLFAVQVVVLPVAGRLVRCPGPVSAPVALVTPAPRPEAVRRLAELVMDRTWRRLLMETDPMPPVARAASPALAADVVASGGVAPGTPVHVVRSYLAPLGLAVAQALASPWASLDLDDDDEALAAAQGDGATAAAYHRLIAAFGPRFSAVSLASPAEADAVARRHGLSTSTVPNGVSIPSAPHHREPRGRNVLLVGNFTYGPNLDAAVVLVDQVLPALESRMGGSVGVTLVGAYATDGPIGRLSSHPSVAVAGFVDDLSPCYGRADVVVAPFTSGAGTRIKILEAFASRVPVVTTTVGASGLAVRHGEHLLIADSPEDLASATAAVLDNGALAAALREAAFEFVRLHHGPDAVARQVRGFLRAASGSGLVR